jgi:hypothetical protein
MVQLCHCRYVEDKTEHWEEDLQQMMGASLRLSYKILCIHRERTTQSDSLPGRQANQLRPVSGLTD